MSNFERYVSATSPNQGIWRFLLGFLFIEVVWIILPAVFLVAILSSNTYVDDQQYPFFSDLDFNPIDAANEVFLLLFTFSFVWAALWLVLKFLHRQAFSTLFSPDGRQKFRLFLSGAAIFLSVLIVSILSIPLTGYNIFDEIKQGIELEKFLILLPFLVFLTFIQIAVEELFYRGYILQQLASRYKSWIVWALLPSLLFGLGHYDSTLNGTTAFLYILATVLIGLIACCLVWRTGSLWPAIGMHMMNNLFAFSILGIEDYFSGTSLWTLPREYLDDSIIYSVIIWAVILLLLISPLGNHFNSQSETN